MRPDARVQAAIEVLSRWLVGDQPAERVLAEWGRANRYAGSGDRRAIADLVYDAVRRKRSAAWLSGAEDGRGLVLGCLTGQGADVEALFSGARHGPEGLHPDERRAAVTPRDLSEAPWGVRLDLPDWLEPELAGVDEDALAPLRDRAPLDLRVNRLKSTPEEALIRLAEDGIEVAPGPLTQDCLRVSKAAHRVHQSRAYLEGLVEIQDAASQAGAQFAQVQPGDDVLDFCAGGGGKTLALAAMQRGAGRLEAYDASPARLAQIPERARRAGCDVTLLNERELSRRAGQFDCVFVDAPCSGAGAWRRSPEAKWHLSPEKLNTLCDLQLRITRDAIGFLRPGGRLIYATCSLLGRENESQVKTFTNEEKRISCELSHCWTDLSEGDGFFAARLAHR